MSFINYLMFMSVVSMQLIEYFAWENLNDKKMIRLLSQLGLFVIFIQVPFRILTFDNIATKIKALVMCLYLIFAAFVVFYLPIDFSMNKAQNGHLAWNWLNFPMYVHVIWLSFMLGLLLYVKAYLYFFINGLIVSAIYYSYYKTNTWGSLWCWMIILTSTLYIIRVFFNSNTTNNCLMSYSKCK
jgi:hypothetical protein